jgi:hypothetical protein
VFNLPLSHVMQVMPCKFKEQIKKFRMNWMVADCPKNMYECISKKKAQGLPYVDRAGGQLSGFMTYSRGMLYLSIVWKRILL